jgi:hypothetical protein
MDLDEGSAGPDDLALSAFRGVVFGDCPQYTSWFGAN